MGHEGAGSRGRKPVDADGPEKPRSHLPAVLRTALQAGERGYVRRHALALPPGLIFC